MPAAFYDFFRKIRFRPSESTTTIPNAITVDTEIEADSVTDTATIVAGQNIAFSIEDSSTATPGQTTDTITIHGPDYQTYVPLGTTKLRLERDLGAESSDIELIPDPLSSILITRTGTNQITIGSSSPTLPFSQEQIEDISAALLTNGTHTELTVTYQDLTTTPSTFAQDATNGPGLGAIFNISIINNTYVASVSSPGSGYVVGNTVTVYGTNWPGGLSPANDATITVGSVDGLGAILTITSITGTPIPSDNIDLAVTSTLENVTGRGASSTNAITISNATGSSNTSTGALKLTAGGLAVFENANVGGYVKATTLQSTQTTGTAPLTVASTTMVTNLQAETASKWHTARTVTFTGDVTGSFTIDGSADLTSVALTVGSDKVALGTDTTGVYVAQGAVSGNGLSGSANSEGATFTVSSNATSVNTAETIVFRDASGNFSAGTITAALTGNASTATTLQTARNINGVSFNGSADITVSATTTNALTIGTGLSGTSFNGSSAVTIAIDSTVATLTGTQTLTNKTLTLPRINDTSSNNRYIFAVSELAADRTITLPLLGADDTFVFAAFSQTLTNKTIAAANNTISGLTNTNLSGSAGITNANLANSSITVNGSSISLGGSATVTANTTNSITFNNGGAGSASGTTFNGSSAITVSYNTIGASPTAGSTSITSVGTLTTAVLTSGTGGIGYATGAGGTGSQATAKTDAVTINECTGLITMNGASLAANTTVQFTLNNTTVAATDLVVVQHVAIGALGSYNITATANASSATVYVRNVTAGALAEAIQLRFAVIKSVNA